jgi:hypothetical protein
LRAVELALATFALAYTFACDLKVCILILTFAFADKNETVNIRTKLNFVCILI